MSEKRARSQRGGGNDGNRSGRSKKPKAPKEKWGDESGQTVEERQHLRAQQHEVKKDAIEQRADIADPSKDNLSDLARRNGELFRSVKYAREAVTDGETLRVISSAAAQQVKKVNQGHGMDMDSFTAHLVKNFSSSVEEGSDTAGFNWVRFGSKCARVFMSVPQGGGFMMGPLDKPAKGPRAQNRAREKIVDKDAKEVVPISQQPKIGKTTKPTKDQQEKRISKMRAHETTEAKLAKKQDLFECLFNPKSFTQTVENLFDFSFFIKTGEGSLGVNDKTGLPELSYDGAQSGDTDDSIPSKQWLMSVTPAEYRELVELYELEASNIPHRSEDKKSAYFDPLVHGFRDVEQ